MKYVQLFGVFGATLLLYSLYFGESIAFNGLLTDENRGVLMDDLITATWINFVIFQFLLMRIFWIGGVVKTSSWAKKYLTNYINFCVSKHVSYISFSMIIGAAITLFVMADELTFSMYLSIYAIQVIMICVLLMVSIANRKRMRYCLCLFLKNNESAESYALSCKGKKQNPRCFVLHNISVWDTYKAIKN